MKKIINDPKTVVPEMCSGIVMAHPELAFDAKYKFVHKKEINKGKVTLISGGGSGHEPAHAGFVGAGMLDVAVCGDVFASVLTGKLLCGDTLPLAVEKAARFTQHCIEQTLPVMEQHPYGLLFEPSLSLL